MTIDQRLEKLAERLEALTQTVELLSHEIESVLAAAREHSKQTARDAERIRALVRVAEIHDRRRTDLEGGDQQ